MRRQNTTKPGELTPDQLELILALKFGTLTAAEKHLANELLAENPELNLDLAPKPQRLHKWVKAVLAASLLLACSLIWAISSTQDRSIQDSNVAANLRLLEHDFVSAGSLLFGTHDSNLWGCSVTRGNSDSIPELTLYSPSALVFSTRPAIDWADRGLPNGTSVHLYEGRQLLHRWDKVKPPLSWSDDVPALKHGHQYRITLSHSGRSSIVYQRSFQVAEQSEFAALASELEALAGEDVPTGVLLCKTIRLRVLRMDFAGAAIDLVTLGKHVGSAPVVGETIYDETLLRMYQRAIGEL